MRLTHVRLRNFRGISSLDLPLAQHTALIGENNVGKSAVLESLSLVTRRLSYIGESPFADEDHILRSGVAPGQPLPPIRVDLEFSETADSQWTEGMVAAIGLPIQIEGRTGGKYLGVRVECTSDPATGDCKALQSFLDLHGNAIPAQQGHWDALREVFSRFHYLRIPALRDSTQFFTARSRTWGRLLRELRIPPATWAPVAEVFRELNQKLLEADPRMARVSETLEALNRVLGGKSGRAVAIRALPGEPWEALSRTEVTYRDRSSELALPIDLHGQGVRSLAIMYADLAFAKFFQAAVSPDTTIMLGIEEPEIHLHPQAVRLLQSELASLPSQTLVSTHSTQFLERVHLEDVRRLSKGTAETTLGLVPGVVCTDVPARPQLEMLVADTARGLEYDSLTRRLTARRRVAPSIVGGIASLYDGEPVVREAVNRWGKQTYKLLTPVDLIKLATYVGRTRGEILFARAWLLCEGQSDFILLSALAQLGGCPLDSIGVSLVDFQNSGSLSPFLSLALCFGIPWVLLSDRDPEGERFAGTARDFIGDAEPIAEVLEYPNVGDTLERFIVAAGLANEAGTALARIGRLPASGTWSPSELVEKAEKDKLAFAHALASVLIEQQLPPERVPPLIIRATETLKAVIGRADARSP